MRPNKSTSANAVGRLVVSGANRFGNRTVTLSANRYVGRKCVSVAAWPSIFYCDQPHRVPELEGCVKRNHGLGE